MAFIPDEPFPKSSGDDIRAKDWNDLVEELKRLDTAKPDLSGSEWAALLTRPVRIKNLVQSSSRAH